MVGHDEQETRHPNGVVYPRLRGGRLMPNRAPLTEAPQENSVPSQQADTEKPTRKGLTTEQRREAGRRGGETTKTRHPGQFEQMGKIGGSTTKERHGSEFYSRIGKKGGNTAAANRRKRS